MEEALIVLIVFGCFVAITKLVLDYARDKHRVRASSGSGSSLTSSELKALVQDAVEDALEARFSQLERRLETMQERPLLSEGKEEIEVAEPTPASPPVRRDLDALR